MEIEFKIQRGKNNFLTQKLDDLKEILESNIPEELRSQLNKLLKEEEKSHLLRVLFERKNFLLREKVRDMFERWRKTQKAVKKRMKSISEAFWHKKNVIMPMNLARALKAKIQRKTSQEYYLSIVRAFWKWKANNFSKSIENVFIILKNRKLKIGEISY